MSQDAQEIKLELIFRQGQRILGELAKLRDMQNEIISRLGRLEREFANLHSDFAGLYEHLDNVVRRLDRIEPRSR